MTLRLSVFALLTSGCVNILGLDEDRQLASTGGAGSGGSAGVAGMAGSGGSAGGSGSGGSAGGGGAGNAYAARVIADGAVAYYRMDETSGDFANAANPALPAKISGGVAQGKPGAVGLGAEFDGINGKATIGDVLDFDAKKPMSIEVWIKAPATGGFRYILNKGIGTTGQEAGYGLSISNQGELQFSRAVGGAFRHSKLPNMTFNTLLHVVGTFDGQASVLYVNGKAVAPANTKAGDLSLPDSTQTLTIGAASSDFGHFNGSIVELAIYDKALNATTIAEHYALASAS